MTGLAIAAAVAGGAAILAAAGWHVLWFRRHGQLPWLRRQQVWSIVIRRGDAPLPSGPGPDGETPDLTAADVTDRDAVFVADPFLVRDAAEDRWVLFAEVLDRATGRGVIGAATSRDLAAWTWAGTVLETDHHLSFPFVFRWNGAWWMIPESLAAGEVRLYRAEALPGPWRLDRTLLRGPYADASIFEHGGAWWMTVARGTSNDELRLFVAEEPPGPWREHADSPVVTDDPGRARPAGPTVAVDGVPHRLAQVCSPVYGRAVRAFPWTQLDGAVARSGSDPVEVATGGAEPWNRIGMHHLHAVPDPDPDAGWIHVLDGHHKQWEIGTRRHCLILGGVSGARWCRPRRPVAGGA